MAESKKLAMDILQDLPTKQLAEILEETDATTAEGVTVRGWLLDELEAREPEKFDNWIEFRYEEPATSIF